MGKKLSLWKRRRNVKYCDTFLKLFILSSDMSCVNTIYYRSESRIECITQYFQVKHMYHSINTTVMPCSWRLCNAMLIAVMWLLLQSHKSPWQKNNERGYSMPNDKSEWNIAKNWSKYTVYHIHAQCDEHINPYAYWRQYMKYYYTSVTTETETLSF